MKLLIFTVFVPLPKLHSEGDTNKIAQHDLVYNIVS